MQIHTKTVHINVQAPPSGPSAFSRAFIEALLRSPEVGEPHQTQPEAAATAPVKGIVPRIGDAWPEHGGIYAGLSRGEDGGHDAHLVLLDEVPENDMNWADAVKWAEDLGNGARLPTRFESALLYANVRDKLDTEKWHWTGTQFSGINAFGQGFNSGNQNYHYESYEGRARAVRRLAL